MINISIITDSSILVSAYNKDDANHGTGLKIITDIENSIYGKEVFISDFIFDETVTVLFSRTGSKSDAAKIGKHIVSSCVLLKVTNAVFQDAFEIFCRDNKLSFTDCTILSMADLYGIKYIATFDKEIKKIFKNSIDS